MVLRWSQRWRPPECCPLLNMFLEEAVPVDRLSQQPLRPMELVNGPACLSR